MPRNSELGKLLGTLTHSAWWIPPAMGVLIYFFLTVGIRHFAAESPALQAFAPFITDIASLALVPFLIMGAITFLNGRRKALLVDQQKNYATLRNLTWKEFEEMVGEAYRRQGYRVLENRKAGADGGVDVRLIKNGERTIIQCKNWKTNKVGVKVVRELYGVMVAEGAHRAIVICSGTFTKDAWTFAQGKPIELLGGKRLLDLISAVQKDPNVQHQHQPQNLSTTTTPPGHNATIEENKSCPSCGRPMILRMAQKGPNAGNQFWGCTGFPKCRATLQIS